jgi:rifampicin phosphotransferase
VDGAEELLRAVRLTWASLWHPAPRSYRRFRGIPEHDVAMAVIVMRMVDASLSGVAFTSDPGGEPASMRIEVVHGLAEKLVSGRVTPRAFVVSRTPPRSRVGGPEVLDSVADLAMQVEEMSGGEPQDVEWASDESVTWLVQARPITVLPVDTEAEGDGFDTPLAAGDVTTTAGIAEMLPGPMPPLVWEVDRLLLEEAFRRLFFALGALPADLDEGLLRRVRGRAGLNLAALQAIAATLPGGSPDEVERQYFGVGSGPDDAQRTDVQRTEPDSHRGPSLRRLRHDLRVLRVRREATLEGEVVIAATEELLARRPHLAEHSVDAVLDYRARLLDLGGRGMEAEVAVASCAVASYRQLETLLSRHLGSGAAERWAQALTARAGAESVRQRRDRLPEVPASLRDVVTDTVDWAEAEARLRSSEGGRAFLAELDAAWQVAGSAALFAGPTWAESPQLAWSWLRSTTSTPAPAAPDGTLAAEELLDACISELQSTRGWRTRRILTGQVVDMRASLVRRSVGESVELLSRRERVKAAVLALGGEVRRTHLELGRRLARRGLLEVAPDVDHLTGGELRQALAGRAPSLEVVARRRRWLERTAATGALPQVFTGPPPRPRAVVHAGSRFTGWGASPGTWTGRVRVVDDPATAELRRGDVLVARSTDASWAPLFLVAGAVVVQEGGPLSHASIVARELRLPAVLNVPEVVDQLRPAQGRLLTVDGSAGTLVLHPRDASRDPVEAVAAP